MIGQISEIELKLRREKTLNKHFAGLDRVSSEAFGGWEGQAARYIHYDSHELDKPIVSLYSEFR